jgi:hypothetical protein
LETNEFEFPTSRNLFYKAAIEELITKRQARREIKQKFEAAEKWQILQRISLNRLETVRTDEDPEELTREAIRKVAAKVFSKEIDFGELIRELVEVNGIIKPSSDGVFTCAHRTIQEYFAASEAGRIRTPKDVVRRFGNRQDLIEVLYFYCGMLRNIPELAKILQSFIDGERWLEAGKCLLNMTEVPPTSYIQRIASELSRRMESAHFQSSLETLSSLAQRPPEEFVSARDCFFQAVHQLAGGNEAAGASALESALATSPDVAMKVIPGLLKHKSKRWQAAAVQLLKDIGTDESLDQLVQLLSSENRFVRAQAGKAIAEIIKTRNQDLRDRIALLPDRRDKIIWPLETSFPGRLAIPVAESQVDFSETGNVAIDCAIRAIQALKRKNISDRAFLKIWKNVPRDLRRNELRVKLGKLLEWGGIVVPVLVVMLLFMIQAWYSRRNRIVVFDVTHLSLQQIDSEPLREVEEKAEAIISKLKASSPPNTSGMARLLPWNWEVEPNLPNAASQDFQKLKGYKKIIDPYEVTNGTLSLPGLSSVALKEDLDAFQQSIAVLNTSLPPLISKCYILVPRWSLSLAFIFSLTILMFLFIPKILKQWIIRKESARHTPKLVKLMFIAIIGKIIVVLLAMEFVVLSLHGSSKSQVAIAYVAMHLSWFAVAFIFQRLTWPNNPLIPSIKDVLPAVPADSTTKTTKGQFRNSNSASDPRFILRLWSGS